MSPMALLIAEGLLTEGSEKALSSFACIAQAAMFDTRDIKEEVNELANRYSTSELWPAAQLPAEHVWIERRYCGKEAIGGLLLESQDNHQAIRIRYFFWGTEDGRGAPLKNATCVREHHLERITPDLDKPQVRRLLATLALINQLKSTEQTSTVHKGHLKRARKVAERAGLRIEVRPYTVCKISLGDAKELQSSTGHQAEIRNGKALHMCRAFFRVRRGKLERVRHHWRGNPELGIVQKSYRVTQ